VAKSYRGDESGFFFVVVVQFFGLFFPIFFSLFFEDDDKKNDKKKQLSRNAFDVTNTFRVLLCCIEFQQRTERRKPATRHRRNSPVSFEALLKKRRSRYDDFHADAMRRNRDYRTRHRDIKGAEGAPNEHQ
jgi:hypothetical protein